MSVLFVGLFVLVSRAALIPILGVPEPSWHDEFSYLLAADTFAHGPADEPASSDGRALRKLSHHPRADLHVHVSTGAGLDPGCGRAGGASLDRAVGDHGADVFGIVLDAARLAASGMGAVRRNAGVLRLGILGYWMNGYWSASVVALAGALVVGALPRLRRHPRVRDAAWLALGLAILANSRPYEGLILGLCAATFLMAWLAGPRRPGLSVALTHVFLPLSIILAVTAVATGYYYYRVTGNPFQMTYQVNRGIFAGALFPVARASAGTGLSPRCHARFLSTRVPGFSGEPDAWRVCA